ncbi:hypothetical protein ABBQ32_004315 [Trebouxia sp. C0010 RCD-2024]
MAYAVDNRTGRALQSALTQSQIVFSKFGKPKPDKFGSGKHGTAYEEMASKLKDIFYVQNLSPFDHPLPPQDETAEETKAKRAKLIKDKRVQFSKWEKIATLGDNLGLVMEACMKPKGKEVLQTQLFGFTDVGWQVWNIWAAKLFASCADPNFHPLGIFTEEEWEEERQRIIMIGNEDIRRAQHANLDQGFYAISMKVLGIGGQKNVWKKYQLEQKPLGSVRLYDPGWHPRLVLRARIDTMYVARHDRVYKDEDKVSQSAAYNFAKVCKAVDNQGGMFAQLHSCHTLAAGSLPETPIQSDIVYVRTRFVPTSFPLRGDRPEVDRRDEADRIVAARFLGYSSDSLLIAGSPSIALSRDDPMRLMYIRAFPAALEAAFTGEPAKLAALFADFQIEVLVDQNPSLEVWENLTVRQERRREYIKSIILQVAASLPSELRGGQGFATAMKSLAFKRLMLYNLIEQFPLASFGQGQKPGGTLESLETFVDVRKIACFLQDHLSSNFPHTICSC